jgi:hypothetical protein
MKLKRISLLVNVPHASNQFLRKYRHRSTIPGSEQSLEGEKDGD